MEHVRLNVNVDHVATVRNARGTSYPDPVHAAILAENAGADGITVHLREDRRHIRERDVEILRATVRRLNLEMARSPEIVEFALEIQPDLCTLVPERRNELTTEGGLDVLSDVAGIAKVVQTLQETGILVSLFVDPDEGQIRAASDSGARFIELHTGRYADARSEEIAAREIAALRTAAEIAARIGLRLNAGHGLRLDNVRAVAAIPEVEELAIGHSIVSRALYVGMEQAVREMREAIRG